MMPCPLVLLYQKDWCSSFPMMYHLFQYFTLNKANKVWGKKIRHITKLAIGKKFTISVQSSWKLVKIIISGVDCFDKILRLRQKLCGQWPIFGCFQFSFPQTLESKCNTVTMGVPKLNFGTCQKKWMILKNSISLPILIPHFYTTF